MALKFQGGKAYSPAPIQFNATPVVSACSSSYRNLEDAIRGLKSFRDAASKVANPGLLAMANKAITDLQAAKSLVSSVEFDIKNLAR